MNEIQFKILEILYYLNIDFNGGYFSPQCIDNKISLGDCAINANENDIELIIKNLNESNYIEYKNDFPPLVKILENGIQSYIKEKRKRKFKIIRENALFWVELVSSIAGIVTLIFVVANIYYAKLTYENLIKNDTKVSISQLDTLNSQIRIMRLESQHEKSKKVFTNMQKCK